MCSKYAFPNICKHETVDQWRNCVSSVLLQTVKQIFFKHDEHGHRAPKNVTLWSRLEGVINQFHKFAVTGVLRERSFPSNDKVWLCTVYKLKELLLRLSFNSHSSQLYSIHHIFCFQKHPRATERPTSIWCSEIRPPCHQECCALCHKQRSSLWNSSECQHCCVRSWWRQTIWCTSFLPMSVELFTMS